MSFTAAFCLWYSTRIFINFQLKTWNQNLLQLFLPSWSLGSLLGTGLCNNKEAWKAVLQDHFLLAISGVSKTRGSTQLLLKLKVFMFEIKWNSIQARDVLMCAKQRTTQWLLLAKRTKPGSSGERELVFMETGASLCYIPKQPSSWGCWTQSPCNAVLLKDLNLLRSK